MILVEASALMVNLINQMREILLLQNLALPHLFEEFFSLIWIFWEKLWISNLEMFPNGSVHIKDEPEDDEYELDTQTFIKTIDIKQEEIHE